MRKVKVDGAICKPLVRTHLCTALITWHSKNVMERPCMKRQPCIHSRVALRCWVFTSCVGFNRWRAGGTCPLHFESEDIISFDPQVCRTLTKNSVHIFDSMTCNNWFNEIKREHGGKSHFMDKNSGEMSYFTSNANSNAMFSRTFRRVLSLTLLWLRD